MKIAKVLLFWSWVWASCSTTVPVAKIEFAQYVLSDTGHHAIDSSLALELLPYKTQLEEEMGQVIGFAAQPLIKGQPESLLGNYVADLALEESGKAYRPADGQGIDFCFLNNGGLRNNLPEGDLTRQNIFELMPFENELVVLTLNGDLVKKVLQWIAAKGGEPVSGLRMKIKSGVPSEALIGGHTFDSSRTYKVLTSSYLASGGSDLVFLDNTLPTEYTGLRIRDAVLQHTQNLYARGLAVDPGLDQRIRYE